jgi:hypothetical protein
VEADFRSARKAHPALVVEGFEALCAELEAHGHPVRPDHDLPGVRRELRRRSVREPDRAHRGVSDPVAG